MELLLTPVHSQPAWGVGNDNVELSLTQAGAQMAPVTFYRGERRPIQPYYLSPWQGEPTAVSAPVLAPLRGDFFCLPFGSNAEPIAGECHPLHGEVAGSRWQLESCRQQNGCVALRVSLRTEVRPGNVTQVLSLRPGQNAVYSETIVEGFAGPSTFGHHAILAVPDEQRTMLLSTRRFALGMTRPGVFSDPARGDYQALARGVPFRSLARVPVLARDEPRADCTAYPARRGFADLLQLFDAVGPKAKPSWVAVVNTVDNWLWYALKDPALMPGRALWIENYGRYSPPSNGRVCCLGIEDGRMFFDLGTPASQRTNAASRLGIPTCIELEGKTPLVVRYIQGVVRVPSGFGRVSAARFSPGRVTFRSAAGCEVAAEVNHEFLFAQVQPWSPCSSRKLPV